MLRIWTYTMLSPMCILVYSIATFHLALAARISSIDRTQHSKNQSINLFQQPRIIDSISDTDEPQYDDNVRIFKRDTNFQQFQSLLKSILPEPKAKPTRRPEKTGDLMFDLIRHMIKEEKERKLFDLIDPPNSKIRQNEQRIWEKLRIKAAGELLLHPARKFKPTERVFDYFKADVEDISQAPVKEELFAPLKEKQQKKFYQKLFNEVFGATATPKTVDRIED